MLVLLSFALRIKLPPETPRNKDWLLESKSWLKESLSGKRLSLVHREPLFHFVCNLHLDCCKMRSLSVEPVECNYLEDMQLLCEQGLSNLFLQVWVGCSLLLLRGPLSPSPMFCLWCCGPELQVCPTFIDCGDRSQPFLLGYFDLTVGKLKVRELFYSFCMYS